MEKKTVNTGVKVTKFRDPDAPLKRAVDLLIAKNGAFRTDERWVWDATHEAVALGVIKVEDDNTLAIGHDFEQFLLKMTETNSAYAGSLSAYRSLLRDRVEEFDLRDNDIMQKLHSLSSADDKIIYLTNLLSSVLAKTEYIVEKTTSFEAKLAEIDVSLSVIESMTFDEDTDG
jgi:hypothetical protein